MFCKYCGKQVVDNAKYCSYCGGKIDQSDPAKTFDAIKEQNK